MNWKKERKKEKNRFKVMNKKELKREKKKKSFSFRKDKREKWISKTYVICHNPDVTNCCHVWGKCRLSPTPSLSPPLIIIIGEPELTLILFNPQRLTLPTNRIEIMSAILPFQPNTSLSRDLGFLEAMGGQKQFRLQILRKKESKKESRRKIKSKRNNMEQGGADTSHALWWVKLNWKIYRMAVAKKLNLRDIRLFFSYVLFSKTVLEERKS